MRKPVKTSLERAISIAEFICEDGGHLEKEAAKEFNISIETVRREIDRIYYSLYSRTYQNNPAKERYLLNLYKRTKSILMKNGNRPNKKIS